MKIYPICCNRYPATRNNNYQTIKFTGNSEDALKEAYNLFSLKEKIVFWGSAITLAPFITPALAKSIIIENKDKISNKISLKNWKLIKKLNIK